MNWSAQTHWPVSHTNRFACSRISAMLYFPLKLLHVPNSFGRRGIESIWKKNTIKFITTADSKVNILCDLKITSVSHCVYHLFYCSMKGTENVFFHSIGQGWPNLLNVRATYDKLQMFESRKTWTNITHTFLLLHAYFVTKILKYIYSPWTLNLRFNPADSQFIPGK
jgi:hypothetical protein